MTPSEKIQAIKDKMIRDWISMKRQNGASENSIEGEMGEQLFQVKMEMKAIIEYLNSQS